jgi:glycosyltransferase involved in cell wall biosynthesis
VGVTKFTGNEVKKKILYLKTDITYKDLHAGGSVSHTLGVIQGFQSLGYDVLCASSAMIQILQHLKLSEFKIVRNPSIFSILKWKINCLLSNIFFTWQTYRWLVNYQLDFIYHRYSPLNCSGIILSRIKKIPLILEYNGSEVWMDNNWNGSPQRFISLTFFLKLFEKFNLKYAQYIVVVSDALKDELIQRSISESKIIVAPNGVNTELYDPATLHHERLEIRNKLFIDEKIVIGFIGTFSAWHGIDTLAQIIPEIIKQRSQVHFILIGDGPLLHSLRETLDKNKLTHEHVTCTGLIATEYARHYLAACDIFISPTKPNGDGSRFFGSPTKLFEYMSLAKPIIASDLEQLSQVIYPALRLENFEQEEFKISNELGIVVNPINVEAFIAATLKLIACDKDMRNLMGLNARKKAIEHYTWQAHTKCIEQFIYPKGS